MRAKGSCIMMAETEMAAVLVMVGKKGSIFVQPNHSLVCQPTLNYAYKLCLISFTASVHSCAGYNLNTPSLNLLWCSVRPDAEGPKMWADGWWWLWSWWPCWYVVILGFNTLPNSPAFQLPHPPPVYLSCNKNEFPVVLFPELEKDESRRYSIRFGIIGTSLLHPKLSYWTAKELAVAGII